MSLAETGDLGCPAPDAEGEPVLRGVCLASASARALTTSGRVPGASAARRRIFSSWRTVRSLSVPVVEQPLDRVDDLGAPT